MILSDARAVLAGIGALALLGLAQVPGPIRIGPSWAAAMPGRPHTADLYTTIANRGVLFDRLAGGACPGFGRLSFTGLDPQTQGPKPQEQGVALPARTSVDLAPGGAHLVLSDVQVPLTKGQLIPCTLNFVHSGQRIVVFAVGPAGKPTLEP